MRWLRRVIKDWLEDRHPVQTPNYLGSSPIMDNHRQLNFGVIEAENGQVMKAYDPATDKLKYWIVPEGKTIGNMVDTHLVARKL